MTVETFRPLNSSHIEEFSYDSESEDLEVTFTSGDRYRYLNVPQRTYRQWTQADSVGQFFHRRIKNAFTYEQI